MSHKKLLVHNPLTSRTRDERTWNLRTSNAYRNRCLEAVYSQSNRINGRIVINVISRPTSLIVLAKHISMPTAPGVVTHPTSNLAGKH
jgi:hypothetical protein